MFEFQNVTLKIFQNEGQFDQYRKNHNYPNMRWKLQKSHQIIFFPQRTRAYYHSRPRSPRITLLRLEGCSFCASVICNVAYANANCDSVTVRGAPLPPVSIAVLFAAVYVTCSNHSQRLFVRLNGRFRASEGTNSTEWAFEPSLRSSPFTRTRRLLAFADEWTRFKRFDVGGDFNSEL